MLPTLSKERVNTQNKTKDTNVSFCINTKDDDNSGVDVIGINETLDKSLISNKNCNKKSAIRHSNEYGFKNKFGDKNPP